jgi:hypothetical protein
MSRQREKNGYQGSKLVGDNSDYRKKVLARAERNAQRAGAPTNAMFSVSDGEFIAACERAGVPNTQRQASKYRNGYGRAALAVGRNVRQTGGSL